MNNDDPTDHVIDNATAALPSADDARQYLHNRIRMKWMSRAVVLLGCALALGALHLFDPTSNDLRTGVLTLIGVVVGLGLADFRLVRRGRDDSVPEVLTNDLARLEQCFAILQKQVTVTIRTSEHAVMEMVDRLNRVHKRSAELQSQIENAVGRSQVLSQTSLTEAGRNGETIETLAMHQKAFMTARKDNQDRIRAVVDQVKHLTPLAALIGDISRQTNLLSINASIEAARAGAEGAGFKVVAAEVRRLSAQTSEAARQITEGIQNVAEAIDGELAAASELEADGAAAQLGELAQHISHISSSLNEVVPYLVNLSTDMDEGMQTMTTDIIDAMGHMQFQDINRQLLEQVESALGSLAEHSAALYALVGGKAPPPPQALEELMQRWVEGYVMQEQRTAHAEIEKRSPHIGRAAQELELVAPDGPRIELF
ncbi:methyl-accepting chemotaxis protein [Aquabacterium sp.]|uniref:methyl-accepting chemotaxis protein n=1 Tax=Aquabacterium sp. TaxID=1872578 RepID=UPI0025BD6D1E|nr:methyl-accepting chemotaxis protein [Aquabacterium sp.]